MLKIYFQEKCFFVTKTPAHFHGFEIGIFDSREKAEQAVEKIKDKPGFCNHKDKIKIQKKFKIFKPRLLNKLFWEDGFITYKY